MRRSLIAAATLPLTLLVGCASTPEWISTPGATRSAATEFGALVRLAPTVLTPADRKAGLSAADIWASGGIEWLIAAAPDANALRVFNASSGALLQTVSPEGDAAFQRPHRVHVVDNLVLVAERDSGRVHLLQLPDFAPLLTFGDGDDQPLSQAQSMLALRMADWGYHVYVTDNYAPSSESGSEAELRRRVKQYALSKGALGWSARAIRAFGEPTGDGRLYRVDAIAGDVAERRLMIADIDTRDVRRVRAYGVNGRYSGRSMGGGVFRSHISGLALLTCGDSGNGLWLATDSGGNGHYLHTFDRDTLDYRASFALPELVEHGSLTVSGGRLFAPLANGVVAGFDLAPVRALRAGC